MKRSIQQILTLLFVLIPLVQASTGIRCATASSMQETNSLKQLGSDLDRILTDARFAGAHWGVLIYSLDRSEYLYARNSSRLYLPASNMKLITAAAALQRLGSDYRFRTLLLTDGAVIEGTLKGNLIIKGYGDPSITVETPEEDPFQTFRHWASVLKTKGIRKISGDILGDNRAFEKPMLGQGWAWDDLTEGYAAPVSALQFNGNRLWLKITPRRTKDAVPSFEVQPLPNYWIVENKLTADADADSEQIEIYRNSSGDGDDSIVLRGIVPANSTGITRAVAVSNPVRYYLSALKHTLNVENIDVLTCGIREITQNDPKEPTLLWTHTSPPLSEIVKPLLKESLNLTAETLTRVLGLELKGNGSYSAGREIVEETLNHMAIDSDGYLYADGSGLSRLNLASADVLVRILGSMYGHPCFPDFYDALSIAGQDGTLESRLKGTKAENNVHAKTGSLSNISTISGYIKTLDGEMLAFSILANNFLVPKSEADAAQDEVLKRLAGFSRK